MMKLNKLTIIADFSDLLDCWEMQDLYDEISECLEDNELVDPFNFDINIDQENNILNVNYMSDVDCNVTEDVLYILNNWFDIEDTEVNFKSEVVIHSV